MPATFTRTPVETERKDPGFGGKPPVDRRPTGGGGDGENWENRPSGRRGPRDLLGRYRMVLFFALASDLMFFIALVSAFFARQSSGHFTANNTWIIDWHPVAIPPILWINTALILLSSLTMEVGRRHFFREIDVMETIGGAGRLFRLQPEQPLLLSDYRHPWPSLADWRSWIGRRDAGPYLSTPHRTETGSGRLHRLVLAHHGCLLDLPVRHACLLPMNRS
jgi:cytochrome c oxidase subunit 3